jgi:hypothetical protein
LWSNRRAFLRRAIGVALLLSGAHILRRVFFPARIGDRERATLAAVLDTLLPDGELPGARRTGVLEPLLAQCAAQRQTRRAIVEGTALVEAAALRRGATSFAALGDEERAQILNECASAARESLPWFFFRTVRDGAMRLHYLHPLAWRAAGLPHAPQPRGYADYDQAPDVG